MPHIEQMLQTHPKKFQGDATALIACIEACFECALSCMACADACLGEQDLQMLVRCIRLNLDGADVCDTTGRILSRLTEPDWGMIRAQLQACVAACRSCGAECDKHASHMAHCKVCADACRRCEEACTRLLGALPSSRQAAA